MNGNEKLKNIFSWLLNIIAIVSGFCSIVGVSVTSLMLKYILNMGIKNTILVAMVLFAISIAVLLVNTYKIHRDKVKVVKTIAENYRKIILKAVESYFDVLKQHKQNALTVTNLSSLYSDYLKSILDYLCIIFESLSKKKICACIKLITYTDEEETVDIDKLTLSTFCRSGNSDIDRGDYEINTINLKDNTDFLEIVDQNYHSGTNYFYQTNLVKYEKQLKKENKQYRNSNYNWSDYYKSTIVVPIMIKSDKLYTQNTNNKKQCYYRVIGFLCVDSLSTHAFLKSQREVNVNILRSVADLLYILLSQYCYYVKKYK